MGFLTTITIYNDGVHLLKPEKLTNEEKDEILQKIYEACIRALPEQRSNTKSVDIGIKGFCNLINVQHPRHADDYTVYVHYGNTVFNINPYNDDFKELAARDPEIANSFLKIARRVLKDASDELKKHR